MPEKVALLHMASEVGPIMVHAVGFVSSEWWSILSLNNFLTLTLRNADVKKENDLF